MKIMECWEPKKDLYILTAESIRKRLIAKKSL